MQMETYYTAKFDCSLNNLSCSRCCVNVPVAGTKKGKKKRIGKAKTVDLHASRSAFACRSNETL